MSTSTKIECENCARLARQLEALRAEFGKVEDANAELGRQLAGVESNMRRIGSENVALRNTLNREREEEPDSPALKRLLGLWRDLYRDGDKRVKIDLDSDRGRRMKRAVKKYGEERIEKCIRGAEQDDWMMGRHPKLRGQGKVFNDVKHILKDEETIERLEELHEQAGRSTKVIPAAGPQGVEALLAKLEGVRQISQWQWMARCPAHEDRHASLSVAQGDKGAVAHCHAGCTIEQIARAVGLGVTELFDPDDIPAAPRMVRRESDPLPSKEDLVAWRDRLLAHEKLLLRLHELKRWSPMTLKTLGLGWDGERIVIPVLDGQGQLVNVLRYLPVRKRGGDRKLLAMRGRPRDLFPAPETVGREVWLVEGEPDAVSGRELGLPAVAVPGTGGWREEYAERFRGRNVFVCFDCDGPGRALVDRVQQSLLPFAAEVWTVDLDPERVDGWDLSDGLLAGLSVESVRGLAVNLVTEVVS